MKNVRKELLFIGTLIAVLSIGGLVNNYFFKNEVGYSRIGFQLITILILVSGFIAYPWRKKPWTDYAGAHTLFCLLLWIGGIELVHWYSSPVKHLYYLFKGLIVIIAGGYLIVQNYKGKYVEYFRINTTFLKEKND
ncbi:MAG: hypothetical protein KKD05_05420 [Candidatus Omnitrophica bacterium]|nr:hypothetical protein [Candidatus Omnitrophota bacterium]